MTISVSDWLLRETHAIRYLEDIFAELCRRLQDKGVVISRAAMHLRLQHPQWLGTRIVWRPGMLKAMLSPFNAEILEQEDFVHSPIKAIHDGTNEIHQRLAHSFVGSTAYPVYDELRNEGATDYFAICLQFTQGKRHAVTFCSDSPNGFTETDLAIFRELSPALALVSEIRIKNRLARTLLATYIGPHAGEEVLNGRLQRGSGVTVDAVIMVCDLRNFTTMSERFALGEITSLLNEYFDAMCSSIERHNGEILKFMGDGLLSIFPISGPSAPLNALRACFDGQEATDALNRKRVAAGLPTLRFGVGLHVGTVMYGNIGSQNRLDFTVIGRAVNVAARLEMLTKEVGRTVLLSESLVYLIPPNAIQIEPVGTFSLRGVTDTVQVYTVADL